MGYPAIQMAVDLDRISALLKEHLSPLQEKVLRLYFGLGCSRSFSATEIAREFEVSRQMISGIPPENERSAGVGPSLVPFIQTIPTVGEPTLPRSDCGRKASFGRNRPATPSSNRIHGKFG